MKAVDTVSFVLLREEKLFPEKISP